MIHGQKYIDVEVYVEDISQWFLHFLYKYFDSEELKKIKLFKRYNLIQTSQQN